MSTIARTTRQLAARSTVLYLVGLVVIAVARYQPTPFDGLSPTASTGIVAVVLAAMSATYLAELAVRAGTVDVTARPTGPTLLVVTGLAGTAVAGFFLATNRPLIGAPFLVGAVLVARAGIVRFARVDGDRER